LTTAARPWRVAFEGLVIRGELLGVALAHGEHEHLGICGKGLGAGDDEIAEGLDLAGGVVAAGSRERARG
jgi:hypothetical protein